MNTLIFFFGSGSVFFVGMAAILLSVVLLTSVHFTRLHLLTPLLTLFGLLLIVGSATPLPYIMYVIFSVLTLVWMLAERRTVGWLARNRHLLRYGTTVAWLVAMAMELPYHRAVNLVVHGNPRVYVMGDSLSAGTGSEKETWPRILASSHNLEVVELSRMGATTASAMQQAGRLPEEGGLVLVEIGGNDLLGETTSAVFARDLDRLLARIVRPGRTVAMFELPLPPFANEFGRMQRALAAKHGVELIPKRVLAGILTGDDATTDSVHLSRRGHERMAEAVWGVIQPTSTR